MQAHWGRYLCVLVAGFLENALIELYSDFAKRTASESVARFAMTSLSRIRNPKAQMFVDTARRFKQSWGDELDVFLGREGRKDAIDSVMANRHPIAHGQDSAITVVRVQEYLDKCIQVVEFIEKQCGRQDPRG